MNNKEIILDALIMTILLIFIVFPIGGLILWSFTQKWMWPSPFPQALGLKYWNLAAQVSLLEALWTGLKVAVIVTIATLIVSIPISYLLARFKFPFKAIILVLFLLPQAFPQLPVYANTAVFLYKLNLGGRIEGVILIQMVGALIYSVWTLTAVFQTIPTSLEEAAVNLGSTYTKAFFHITFPLSVPGIIASSILVFLWSLDEFTGTLLIGSPFVKTLSTFMYQAAQGYELQVASVTAIILMIPGILLLTLLEKHLKSEYLSKFGGI